MIRNYLVRGLVLLSCFCAAIPPASADLILAASLRYDLDPTQSYLDVSGDVLALFRGTPQPLVQSGPGGARAFFSGQVQFDIFYDDVALTYVVGITPGDILTALPNPNVPANRYDNEGPGSGGSVDTYGLIASDPNGVGGPLDTELIVRDGALKLSSNLFACPTCFTDATEFSFGDAAIFVEVSSAIADSPIFTSSIAGGPELNSADDPLTANSLPMGAFEFNLPLRRESGEGTDLHIILEGQLVGNIAPTIVPLPGAIYLLGSALVLPLLRRRA